MGPQHCPVLKPEPRITALPFKPSPLPGRGCLAIAGHISLQGPESLSVAGPGSQVDPALAFCCKDTLVQVSPILPQYKCPGLFGSSWAKVWGRQLTSATGHQLSIEPDVFVSLKRKFQGILYFSLPFDVISSAILIHHVQVKPNSFPPPGMPW